MYYFYFIFCYLFSLIPLRLLYLLSDGIYYLLYHVIRYRKTVVMQNLSHAFPDKTSAEREGIARKFYHNLSDMMVETIKLMTISSKTLNKRFTADLSLLKEIENKGKTCQVHLGHFFNWEWANLYIKTRINCPVLVTYMPLHNRSADRLFNYMRSRFESVMIPANDVLTAMKPWQNKNYISVLVADQNPGKVRRAYWYPFMHKMTAFYKGPELSARRNDIPVIFGEIKRIKRGYYQIVLTLLSDHPQREAEGSITLSFAKMLEKSIREQPENWVWSHRRWKHVWKANAG